MIKCKKIHYCFLFIFCLALSSWANAMDLDSMDLDSEEYLNSPRHHIEKNNNNILPTDVEERESQTLKTYFKPTTVVWIPNTTEQVVAGLFSGFCAAAFTNISGPVGIKTLELFGVTGDVIPTDGWQSDLYAAGMMAPPIFIGCFAAYCSVARKGALYNIWQTAKRVKTWCFSRGCCPPPPDEENDPGSEAYSQAQEAVTKREFSILESCIYSTPTQAVQLLVWGGLGFVCVWDVESGVDASWGGPLPWQISFGVSSVVLSHSLFVIPTNNPNKNLFWRLFRSFTKNEAHNKFFKIKQECLEPIKDMQDLIKHKGLTPKARQVCEVLNIILPEEPEEVMDQNTPLSPPTISRISDNKNPKKYILLFKEMMDAAKELPPHIKTWRGKSADISAGISAGLGVFSFPGKVLLTYYLPHALLTTCSVRENISQGIGIATATLLSPLVALSSIKEDSLIRKECNHLLDWFYMPKSGWGRPGFLARAAATVYATTYITNHLIQKVLYDIGISNLPGRAILGGGVGTGLIWAAYNQFYDTQFEEISNWILTGGISPFSCCCPEDFKIFPCIDRNGKRKACLELTRKLKELEDKVWDLNEKYTEILYNTLQNQPPKNTEKEDTNNLEIEEAFA